MLPLVTLCGSYNFESTLVKRCIDSWKQLLNIDPDHRYLIPDAGLRGEDAEEFKRMGFHIFNQPFQQDALNNFLRRFPHLQKMREKDLTWRKILDTTFHLSHFERIVLIDTDVLVNCPCVLPEVESEFVYMLEDIPAYRGNWRVAWREKLVPAFNAGLVIYKPSSIDYEFLEFLAKTYIINCRTYWCSEQLAWSGLAGRAGTKHIFDSNQVRVVSGFMKRSHEQMLSNQYVHWSRRGAVQHFSQFRPYIEGSMILHFAGLGKRWFEPSYDFLLQKDHAGVDPLIKAIPDRLLSLKDKCLISTRLLLKELAM